MRPNPSFGHRELRQRRRVQPVREPPRAPVKPAPTTTTSFREGSSAVGGSKGFAVARQYDWASSSKVEIFPWHSTCSRSRQSVPLIGNDPVCLLRRHHRPEQRPFLKSSVPIRVWTFVGRGNGFDGFSRSAAVRNCRPQPASRPARAPRRTTGKRRARQGPALHRLRHDGIRFISRP